MITSYSPSDDGYDDLYDDWVDSGGAGQFELWGETGGKLWQAIWPQGGTQPTFVLAAADGPTSLSTSDDPEETGVQTAKGYYLTMQEHGLKFRRGRSRRTRGKVRIGFRERPLEED